MAAAAPSAKVAASAASAEVDTGNYEVIRGRLGALAKELGAKAEALNARRKEVFGGTELTVVGNERVRTEHNCVPRDIVNAGGHLLFGFNVFLGLKTETRIEDVFGLYRLGRTEQGWDLEAEPFGALPGFLDHPNFVKEFRELVNYYKDARLMQLRASETRLLAVFQTGNSPKDIRVFRWGLDPKRRPTYLDNRGERDHVYPPSHDFTWTATTREQHVQGRHPHINILDQVFVETVGGDLTVKVEDNTEEGQGVYSEPVDDANQSLDDAQVYYARVGTLILLKVLPYREQVWRHLVFNTRTHHVVRIDAIGQACVQLPEDHGIIFPGGYYLQSGDFKVFDGDLSDLEFKRMLRSPNGEDVLYVFHRRVEGSYVLFPYNLIDKQIRTAIHAHGYSLFDDGTLVIFRNTGSEPTRVHPLQIWQTPFTSAEFHAAVPTDGSFLSKVGNADLVRGISDVLSVRRLIEQDSPNRQIYEDLIAAATRVMDAYYWLGSDEVGDLATSLKAVRQNAELIVDEFEKVLVLRQRAAEALAEAAEAKLVLERDLRPEGWRSVEPFMNALAAIRSQRGHVITLGEVRYIDRDQLGRLEAELVAHFDRVSKAAVEFLLRDDALQPLAEQLEGLLGRIEGVQKTPDVPPLREQLERTSEGLNVLTEVVGALEIEDPSARTRILEGISELFGQVNRVRATLERRRKELATAEGRAEFAAQFRLFSQAVSSALTIADTPERCDEQLSRLMVQLEELEGRFGELDAFISDLATKREEVYEAFEAKKQALLDERQRRASSLFDAADRILQGIARRARGFKTADELNAYFASDAMVAKLRQIAEQLLALGDSVKADELGSRLKSTRQEAARALRDKSELFDGDDAVIKLGRHRFNVNTQPLELTMVPRGDRMALHLTGTDYYELIEDAAFEATRDFWSQQVVSETPEVYRGEYLAATLLFDAVAGQGGASLQRLHEAARAPGGLAELVRAAAASRYDEGYERGLHDADATLILEKLLSLWDTAGLLRFSAPARALGCLFWAFAPHESELSAACAAWHRRATSYGRLRAAFGQGAPLRALGGELGRAIAEFAAAHHIACDVTTAGLAGQYLAEELTAEAPRFVSSADADRLVHLLVEALDRAGERAAFEADLTVLEGRHAARLALAREWLAGFVASSQDERVTVLHAAIEEAATLLVTAERLDRQTSAARGSAEVTGLLGQHPRIAERKMTLRLDEVLARLTAFVSERVPGYRAYRVTVRELLERERARLRLDELMPRVLSSFVRNRLINEVYLPILGDNLAKQIGAVGDAKRTDLNGLLLLISPPGYGKTTLMEYVASRLGLVFVKVNGPALGHGVTSIDPAEAPNATSRQEVDKINLALEMGNNVMLYLDDIQHTHPELLQKFISLCDGQRRIEGVWKGKTRTYDLRGKKFCVVMAGNPYTESGDKFQIPDMLANRADTYNLGDILDGKADAFALSYIENALTSNPTLAPLAGRDQQDVYKLIKMARGEQVATTELSYGYSAVELNELRATFQHLFAVQEVLLKVNLQYIASASQDDAYRTEPPFKLQGSYRNMAKLAAKVAPAMNPDELQALIDDHYVGEAQTLTTGAEANLLKLAELRGRSTPEQAARWAEIKKGFARVQLMGGKEDDPVTRVTGQLSALSDQVSLLRDALIAALRDAAVHKTAGAAFDPSSLEPVVARLDQALRQLATPQLDVNVTTPPLDVGRLSALIDAQVQAIQQTLLPIAHSAARNLETGQDIGRRLTILVDQLLGEQQRRATVPTPTGAPKPRVKPQP